MKAKAKIFSHRAALSALLFALLGGVLVSACSKTPDDSAIKSAIESSYYADPNLKSTNLQVVVTKGQVMLAGEVSSEQMKQHAEMLAKAAKGVASVEDRIAVAGPLPQPQQAAAAQPAETPAPAKPARKARLPRRVAPAPTQAQTAESQPAQQPAEQTATAEPPTEPAPTTEPPPAPQPTQVTIPAGSHLAVRIIDSIDSSKNQAGQAFRASLDKPIIVEGETVVPAGADVTVRLAVAKTAGRMTGTSELELQLVKMVFAGQDYRLVSNSYTAKGKSRGKDTATKVGAGAAIGAVIGAIAGGGKGAAIGAAAGAGAGSAAQLATRGQQVKVPSETLLDFVLQQPVTVVIPPAQQ